MPHAIHVLSDGAATGKVEIILGWSISNGYCRTIHAMELLAQQSRSMLDL